MISALLFPPDVPEKNVGFFHVRQCRIIDLFKGLTPFVILLAILFRSEEPYNAQWNPIAWTYFGIHGCYGVLWVSKTLLGFGDPRFKTYKPLFFTYFLVGPALIFYWIPIWIIVNQSKTERAPIYMAGICVFMFGLGVFWHFCSDIQKVVFLETRARMKKELGDKNKNVDNLLKTKLWAICRNPNYFGELLIYSSFCLLSWHWFPALWLLMMVSLYWYPGMLLKEKSLSRFGKEWEEYKNSSWFLIPYIW